MASDLRPHQGAKEPQMIQNQKCMILIPTHNTEFHTCYVLTVDYACIKQPFIYCKFFKYRYRLGIDPSCDEMNKVERHILMIIGDEPGRVLYGDRNRFNQRY